MPSGKVSVQMVLRHPVHLISFGLGTGLFPKAPGTVGTLLGFALFWPLMSLDTVGQAAALALLFLFGAVACQVTGKAVGEADHSGIVIDEIVCFAMVLAFVPRSAAWWGAAFVAFRFFDIVKIWPASWVDRNMKNGLGVMLDDFVAAGFAVVVLVGMQAALGAGAA